MNEKTINQLNKVVTYLIYAVYPIVLIVLLTEDDTRFWRVLFVPALSFIMVSLFRNHFNAPRPYEVTGKPPIIKKTTKGKSFPSRHVFSAFVIATSVYFITKPFGLFLFIAGLILAFLRVVGGVHFTRDVIAGALIGIIAGMIGLYW
ncbi:phosphatase PAP2 family protein [Alkalibacterium kapii]|uniref:Acid phosphatase n=1 Tax=Alkalibacterium kapii TaxID=426704 RepID=A0A511AX06_9LACT|nr:phosphatase PAP2 family protein [Alkalibacterium kapii]GEK91651.1 acid phosphatase [Alkalibacterium kapii]